MRFDIHIPSILFCLIPVRSGVDSFSLRLSISLLFLQIWHPRKKQHFSLFIQWHSDCGIFFRWVNKFDFLALIQKNNVLSLRPIFKMYDLMIHFYKIQDRIQWHKYTCGSVSIFDNTLIPKIQDIIVLLKLIFLLVVTFKIWNVQTHTTYSINSHSFCMCLYQ